MRKFRNIKTVTSNGKFDSKKEAKHFGIFKSEFGLSVSRGKQLEIVPKQKIQGKTIRAVTYKPDYVVETVIESKSVWEMSVVHRYYIDTKSSRKSLCPVYKLKEKLCYQKGIYVIRCCSDLEAISIIQDIKAGLTPETLCAKYL